MKKKTSVVAILFAVIMSIILLPLIFAGSAVSGGVFSAASVLEPGKEEDIYNTFVENGGVDWIYDMFVEGANSQISTEGGMEVSIEEIFTKEDVENTVDGIFHAIIKGEEYYFDLSVQQARLLELSMEYFEEEIDDIVKEEMGASYERATEAEKEEIKQEARAEYKAEMERAIEEEISALEQELSSGINEFYASEEYQDVKEFEEEYGYSLADRNELCKEIRLGANILFAITVVLMFLVVLCHFFRPSGFFTAGAFSLVIGGIMTAAVRIIPNLLNGALYEELAESGVHDSVYAVIEEIVSWLGSGFSTVSRYNLIAGVVLILLGVLVLVNRKNNTAAE